MADHYDAIIIGSGAGGGTLFHALAPTGKRILLLERGDYVPRERDNWSTRAVHLDGKYAARETWRDAAGGDLRPHTNYCVGGNTKFYGAALFRLRREDFGEVKHWGGISPAWPIDYDELEPYYTAAERLYQVHGARGADPTEPPASAPYPHSPVSHEPRIQALHDDFARQGLRPFHVPLGILLDEGDRRHSRCLRCETCDGHPCLVSAKADAQVMCVDPALAHANATLLTGARVTRLEASATGREITRVVLEREGATETVSGDVVVVSCGAINSAALLLRSASGRHPHGLANGSGVVGRHYMSHNNSMLVALSREPNPTLFHKTFAMTDFYFGADDFPFPLGCIQLMGNAHAEVLGEGAPPGTPKRILRLMASHGIPFWLTSEDLPDPENRVALTSDGGIQLRYTPNNLAGHALLGAKVRAMLARARMKRIVPANLYVGGRIPLAGVAHQCGTVRFGTDPKSSALDTICRAHEVSNLYVVDGSFFPSSAAVNPALTIMANALRVGDRILGRLA